MHLSLSISFTCSLSLSLSYLAVVSAFVPSSSLLNPTTAESHFIPPQVYLSNLPVYLSLAHCLVTLSSCVIHPVCFVSLVFFFCCSLCKSHLFPSLSYLSLLALVCLCVPDSEPAETKGHGGLTLIDVSDTEEEEVREGWLWPDKVNSVFPSGN